MGIRKTKPKPTRPIEQFLPPRQIHANRNKFVIWLDDLSFAQERLKILGDKIDKDLILKNYEIHIDLYKHYLDLVIKHSIFYYAITGAIVSFCFANKSVPFMGYALFFPALMSLLISILYLIGASRIRYVDEEFDCFLEIFGITPPDVNILKYILLGSAFLYVLVALALIILFFKVFFINL